MSEKKNIKRELYESVKAQNEMIDVESAKMRDKYSTDLKRVQQMQNNIMGWNVFNFYLWVIYYVVVFIIIYLFVKDQLDVFPNQKLYFSVALLLYPFLITTIELLLYYLFDFLISVIKGVPYPKYSKKEASVSIFDSLPALYY